MVFRGLTWLTLGLAFLLVDAIAQETQNPDCFFECIEQKNTLAKFGFTFPLAISEIEQSFGLPAQVVSGRNHRITRYQGVAGDVLLLEPAGRRRAIAYAIIRRESPAHLPVAAIQLSTHPKGLVLADLLPELVASGCAGKHSDGIIGANYAYTWVLDCRFAASQKGLQYSFIYNGPVGCGVENNRFPNAKSLMNPECEFEKKTPDAVVVSRAINPADLDAISMFAFNYGHID